MATDQQRVEVLELEVEERLKRDFSAETETRVGAGMCPVEHHHHMTYLPPYLPLLSLDSCQQIWLIPNYS